jgi:hypothetical protein
MVLRWEMGLGSGLPRVGILKGMMLVELSMRWFGEHRSSNEGLGVTLNPV